jgi:hypothetical protein
MDFDYSIKYRWKNTKCYRGSEMIMDKIKKYMVLSYEDKKVLTLFFRLALPTTIPIILIIIFIYYFDSIILHFRAFVYLAAILIFGLYGLYKLIKGE